MHRHDFGKKHWILFGVVSFLWFITRTGTKPSRIMYPCQRAALANSSMLLGALIPISLAASLTKTRKFLSRRGMALALLTLLACSVMLSEQFWGGFQWAGAADPFQELQLALESKNASTFPASDIFVVNGRASAHIRKLIDVMGSHGLFFYKSDAHGLNQGPNGLIARDDVVLIKVNEQWAYRGGTNTDVLKELIQAIVGHPDGFVGEVVVADCGQGRGGLNLSQSNAEDVNQSALDVVDMFSSSHRVSGFDWNKIRQTRVSDYADGDMTDGYILYDNADPETGIYVSYPKFKTVFGTYVSFKHGIWNGTGYEKRLKVINMPVLKSHALYWVTASVKHYMGVQSQHLGNGHDTVETGGMGTLMVETGLPTLNIVDAIWINANPPLSGLCGPETSYKAATRVNILLASTDPVAVDWWAARRVLMQAANAVGYDYENTQIYYETAFGRWMNLSKTEIVEAGYNVTMDENRMNVDVYSEPAKIADVNGDGIVNILDVSIVAKAFGSTEGNPRWNAAADLDGNDVVNIVDVSIVAKDYGKTVSHNGGADFFFSFEDDMQQWEARAMDLELANSTIDWSIVRSQERAKNGSSALKFYLENWNDMGKIWIERCFVVKPNTLYRVDVSYALASADWGVANFFRIITGILQEPPKTRDELVYQGHTGNGADSDVGYVWLDKSYNFTVQSDWSGKLYVIIGVWGVWETPRTYYLDNLKVVFSQLQS